MTIDIKVSLKDKRILRELFVDGRMHYSKIAKKVGLSKQVVHYRIKRMHDLGLLIGFNSVYNVQRIGWQSYMVFLKLKSINNNKKTEIIEFLTKHPNTAWVIKCIGNYDLVLKFFVKNVLELNKILKNIESKYDQFFDNYESDHIETEHLVPVPFLYAPLKHKFIPEQKQEGVVKVSNLDIQVLESLAKESRIQLSDLAIKLNVSRDLVKYHLKKLEDKKIIVKYRPSAWSGSKSVGYSWYLITLKFKQLTKQKLKSLNTYLQTNPNVTYIYELIGQHDFGFEIRLKTGDELNEVLMEIRSLLGEDLKQHDLNLILKEYKYTYFPKCLRETNS
ncbi:Lrp/AsnC family transcriptional regulator [archaeon]|jgi:Lrp/AsnC family transcriptional regulator, regulator for asnA, asnC and gidA|nr:Lrp/AsnC family transcriptional regulator [archaeon]MBT4022478.1 Lrp/AsnC family transcriptional regulator [archaeon]MBT4272317.1 Lrp/AsnC family transcriptional regulator [archaeon]MBT4460426.1 Lrp/AsnC family transcriptional regulator [archaeon]MBT4858445.1 Lrp/AsnC family transcriptional regulator [archaeon]